VCYDDLATGNFFPSASKKVRSMKLPRLPSETKPALWGALAGAIAVAVVGFSWGGWVTAGTADQLAKKEPDAAVVMALAPICVENFQRQPDAVANLAALKETSSYQQARFIENGGWATMPGAESPHTGTARACANMLRSLTVQ
jgi:pimeloyl-ACP methyl ester carboxylesterase